MKFLYPFSMAATMMTLAVINLGNSRWIAMACATIGGVWIGSLATTIVEALHGD